MIINIKAPIRKMEINNGVLNMKLEIENLIILSYKETSINSLLKYGQEKIEMIFANFVFFFISRNTMNFIYFKVLFSQ